MLPRLDRRKYGRAPNKCAQGETDVTLTVEVDEDGTASGLFHFYANQYANRNIPEGCFTMTGHVDRSTGRVDLRGKRWLLHPDGYVTVDLHGNVQAGGVAGRSHENNLMLGTVAGPGCSDFMLVRSGTLPFPFDLNRAPSACYSAPVS